MLFAEQNEVHLHHSFLNAHLLLGILHRFDRSLSISFAGKIHNNIVLVDNIALNSMFEFNKIFVSN